MESKCLSKVGAESETCIKSVKTEMQKTDLPWLKNTFMSYLDF